MYPVWDPEPTWKSGQAIEGIPRQESGLWGLLWALSLSGCYISGSKYCRTNGPNKMMRRVVTSNILTLFPYTHITNYFYLSSTSLSSYHPHGLCCFFSAKASTKWVWHSPLLSLTPRHSALHIDILHIMVEWMNENSVWFFNISLMSFQSVNYSVIPKCPELQPWSLPSENASFLGLMLPLLLLGCLLFHHL